MNLSALQRYQDEKDELMRNEGTHPANQPIKDNFGGMNGVDPNSHGVELQ